MKRRIFTLILAVMTLVPVVFGGQAVCAAADTAYADTSVQSWYFQSVTFCSELGLMNGIGQGQFAPAGTVNRAMFVTILHRLAGSPDAAASSFTDVPADSFYARAVNWAAEQGIVNGTGENTFSPERSILRQDMACSRETEHAISALWTPPTVPKPRPYLPGLPWQWRSSPVLPSWKPTAKPTISA